MPDNKLIAANNVVLQLNASPEDGVELALDFAIRFAAKSQERNNLIIACANFNSAQTEEARIEYTDEIKRLVNSIKLEVETPAQKQIQETEKAVQAFFAKQEVSKDVVFECKHVKFKYNSKFGLKDINLTLNLGEITGIVGENANGKTTLCRIIAGQLAQDEGEVNFGALDPDKKFDWEQIKKQIAFLEQEPVRESWYTTVRESLQVDATLCEIPPEEQDLMIDYLIQRLGLAGYEDHTWSKLSGGYKLRFRLARLLLAKPKLLILDEPLANLDIKGQITILSDIRDLCKSMRNPVAVVITSQHIHEIESIADEVIHLRAGEIIWHKGRDMTMDPNENCFEFGCNLSLVKLREILKPISNTKLIYDGFNYLIVTPGGFSAADMLSFLISNDVKINYFRDISNSVKKSMLLR